MAAVWAECSAIWCRHGSARLFFLSTHGERSLYDCAFEKGDALVFGNESSGLPKGFYERYRDWLFKIPMPGEHARSINFANGRDEELGGGVIPAVEPLPREENAYCLEIVGQYAV